MSRPSIFTAETLTMARRLREEDGKTFDEISKILGINSTSIKKTAKRENWSNKKSSLNKEEAIKATAKVKEIKQNNREHNEQADELLKKLKEIGIENIKNFGKIALEPLLLKSIKLAMTSNNAKVVSETIKDLIKVIESDALQIEEAERKLTIMIPQIEETYEDPPQAA